MVTIYFFDSSALVKCYAREPGSRWVWATAQPRADTTVWTSRLTWVETLSALSRRKREGTIEEPALAREFDLLRFHFAMQYQIAEIDATVIQLAGEVVQAHPLRAADAIQLATAMRLHAALGPGEATFSFVCADARLLLAAEQAGLHTVNPISAD